jgi:hypothetical protein
VLGDNMDDNTFNLLLDILDRLDDNLYSNFIENKEYESIMLKIIDSIKDSSIVEAAKEKIDN